MSRLLSGKVWIVRCLFGVVFRYDRIVAGRVHHGLSMDRRSGSCWHGHRHRHLLQGLILVLGWIRLRRVATGCGVVTWHRLRHARRPRLVHRVDSRSGGVLLHYDPSRSRSWGWHPGRIRAHVHWIRSYVVLGGCDHYRCGNDGTLVSPSLAAHPAQREEHKQNEKYDDRNEDIHRC